MQTHREHLISRARWQYANYGLINSSMAARLAEEGVIVDELLDSFDTEVGEPTTQENV